jgi:hypothetical protein
MDLGRFIVICYVFSVRAFFLHLLSYEQTELEI